MATNLVCSLLLLFFTLVLSVLSPARSATGSSPSTTLIDWWCDHTPYPVQCKSSLQNVQPTILPRRRSQFRKMAIDAAMKWALQAQSHNKWLGSKCRNHKERVAWADCMMLYQSTIAQLNHTTEPGTNATPFDIQTWLSTALTNHDTCRAGFNELGVSDYVLPLMSNNNNVSKLISNALAINNATLTPQTNS
ncbi:hypothetical protein CRG98_013828, partial [Punica granatum]